MPGLLFALDLEGWGCDILLRQFCQQKGGSWETCLVTTQRQYDLSSTGKAPSFRDRLDLGMQCPREDLEVSKPHAGLRWLDLRSVRSSSIMGSPLNKRPRKPQHLQEALMGPDGLVKSLQGAVFSQDLMMAMWQQLFVRVRRIVSISTLSGRLAQREIGA